jgi:hypothetical protein
MGIQKLPGYKDVKTTMVYTHVLNQGPVDELFSQCLWQFRPWGVIPQLCEPGVL